MKVGDLVKLSAYGAARKYNLSITKVDQNLVGLIIEVCPMIVSYPYKVQWVRSAKAAVGPRFSRRELKYAHR